MDEMITSTAVSDTIIILSLQTSSPRHPGISHSLGTFRFLLVPHSFHVSFKALSYWFVCNVQCRYITWKILYSLISHALPHWSHDRTDNNILIYSKRIYLYQHDYSRCKYLQLANIYIKRITLSQILLPHHQRSIIVVFGIYTFPLAEDINSNKSIDSWSVCATSNTIIWETMCRNTYFMWNQRTPKQAIPRVL